MEFDYHRLAIVFGPILSHAASLSLVDLFEHFRKAPESMSPDIASLMFVAATSIIVENWLENYMLRPRIDSAKTFVLVVCKMDCFNFDSQIVLNITICELALRLLWIPTLYLLRYLRDEKILAVTVRLIFCYLQKFARTRRLLSKLIKASEEEAGFNFARNLVAGIYFLCTISMCNCHQKLRHLRLPRFGRQLSAIGYESTHLE